MNPIDITGSSKYLLRRWIIASLGNRRKPGATGQEGYILQIALVAFLMLMIGTVAFATRAYSGFFGAVFQSANREARDVAESSITDFQNTLNRVENRYLLVQGMDPSSTSLNRAWNTSVVNPCNAPLEDNEPDIDDMTTAQKPTTATISRFDPRANGGWQKLQANSTDARKEFRVEAIEYRDSSRSAYTSTPEAILNGASRGLIRVTIIGRVTRNGVISTSRVTREFEVVPKCCSLSFGKNTYGGSNWGRDSRVCFVKSNTTGGGNGVIGALDGGALSGTNNISLKDETGSTITQAICYDGIPSPSSGTELSNNVNTACSQGTASAGSASFNPLKFDLTLPNYCTLDAAFNCSESGRSDSDTLADLTTGGNDKYIYFDTSINQIQLCKANMSGGGSSTLQSISSCTNLNGTSTSSAADDPCWYSLMGSSSTASLPYHVANCRIDHFKLGNGTVFIDTTAAKINLFVDIDNRYISTQGSGTSTAATQSSDEYMEGGGNTSYKHVHCYGSQRNGANTGTRSLLVKPNTSNYVSTPCKNEPSANNNAGGYFEKCKSILSGCPQDWDLAELLNVFTLGNGKFTINGTSSTVGFNLIAPYATVEVKGGGNANPNLMGRIWADAITFTGNSKIIALSSNPSFCATENCPDPKGASVFDFIARSFSHASGY